MTSQVSKTDCELCTQPAQAPKSCQKTLLDTETGETPGYLDQYAKLTLFHSHQLSKRPQIQEKTYDFPNGYNLSSAYYSYLAGIERGWHAQRCIKHGELHRCPRCKLAVFKAGVCGDRKVCVICGDNYTKHMADVVMRTVNVVSEVVPDLTVIFINFTVPEPIQKLIDYGNGFDLFNKVCKKTLYDYVNYSNEKNIFMPAGLHNSHTWHSSDPLRGWFPHNHSVWLDIVYNKAKHCFEKINCYLDVNLLRKLYLKNLNKEFCMNLKETNVNAKYHTVEGKTYSMKQRRTIPSRVLIRHKIKYALRMPQADITNYSNGYRNAGHGWVKTEEPLTEYTEEESAHINRILLPPPNWRKTRWVGWLADGVRSKYLKLLSIDPNLLKEDKEPEENVCCPICHVVCELEDSSVIAENINEPWAYPWDPGGIP